MNKVLTFVCSLFLLFGSNELFAQTGSQAKTILDKTASLIKRSNDMEISFSASSFMEGKEKGTISGTIFLKDKKFHLTSTNILAWFDGKTMWSFNKDNNEVNVTTPSLHEKETMNPYLFIDLYKSGYTYSLSSTTLRNRDCYEIHLKASNKKKEVKEMILTIDKKTSLPLCVRLREGAQYWVRISILKCKTKQNYPNSTFTFNQKDYPSASVIDMR